jgi:hypothetical protein
LRETVISITAFVKKLTTCEHFIDGLFSLVFFVVVSTLMTPMLSRVYSMTYINIVNKHNLWIRGIFSHYQHDPDQFSPISHLPAGFTLEHKKPAHLRGEPVQYSPVK